MYAEKDYSENASTPRSIFEIYKFGSLAFVYIFVPLVAGGLAGALHIAHEKMTEMPVF